MAQASSKEHDLAHRELFSHPELVEDLLRHHVRESWVEEIDFQTLQRENEISVVRGKGAKIRDVVWSVNFRGRPLYLLILREPENEGLRQAFKGLILRQLSPEFAPIAEAFDHPEDLMTTKQRLDNWLIETKSASRQEGLQLGIEKGLQEGLQKGLQKGRSEGQRSLLAKLLQLKFGQLDASTEARLAKASAAQLGVWGERVLTASSLDEIWSN